MATKDEFLAAWERELKAAHSWTKDETKLAEFMLLARQTISSGAPKVNLAGPAFERALAAVGLPPDTTPWMLVNLDECDYSAAWCLAAREGRRKARAAGLSAAVHAAIRPFERPKTPRHSK